MPLRPTSPMLPHHEQATNATHHTKRCRRLVILLPVVVGLLHSVAHGQPMTKNEYIAHLPLHYPRLVRQVAANVQMQIYGDEQNPGYVDVNPRDGIDDARGETLRALGRQFAPYLVLNTTELPLDFKSFMDQRRAFKLHIDTWNLGAAPKEVVREETIDFNSLLTAPCQQDSLADTKVSSDDCRLQALLVEFDADHPTAEKYTAAAVDPYNEIFKVLYWDFPGYDPATWKEEYENQFSHEQPLSYRNLSKLYLHPFIEEIRTPNQGTLGYEFVLQYWLFYPSNDGANNHEGDWEHINVTIAPRSQVTRLQQESDIALILSGKGLATGAADPLVIKRVDYYFHHKVWVLDYANPNVYQPREAWEQELKGRTEERAAQSTIWKEIRKRAYQDKAETILNTHPIGFIGADSKGLELLMAFPGGKNRDSHGTYPFHGFYKNVATAGAAEQISAPFDYFKFFEKPDKRRKKVSRGYVETFAEGDNIELVPDWERVRELANSEPKARREWSWLLLPMRWGYPASQSPFAGTVEHADFGNAAPHGPTFNRGWNRSGASAGFTDYAPHRFNSWFALGITDAFQNSWGFLNALVPVFTVLPPFDLVYRVVAAPVRLVASDQQPSFLDKQDIPFRFLSISGGTTTQRLGDEFANLVIADKLIPQIYFALGLNDSTRVFETGRSVDQPIEPCYGVRFHVGSKFTSENVLWNTDTGMRIDLTESTTGKDSRITSNLNMWEYAGSLRYNLARNRFQPYGKVGYGVSWYRVENTAVDGLELASPQTDWITTFNWHWGIGLEAVLVQSYSSLPRGIDVGLQLDFMRIHHSLGLDQVVNPISLAALSVTSGGITQRVAREVVNLALVISF